MANGKYLVVAAIVTGLLVLNLFFPGVGSLSFGHSSTGPSVTHIVLFEYKRNAKPEDIAEVTTESGFTITGQILTCGNEQTNRRMLALKENCIHPDKGHPYIKSLTGGRDNSIEGLQVSHYLHGTCSSLLTVCRLYCRTTLHMPLSSSLTRRQSELSMSISMKLIKRSRNSLAMS